LKDAADDKKVGVQSLAILLGEKAWIFLGFLGVLQVVFFAMTALKANMSLIFWVFGVAVWAVNIPWHVLSLDLQDRKSGGRIFKRNIILGLWMTGVALAELATTRVNISSLIDAWDRAGFSA